MRKLASIQRIKDLHPIEGADAIEKATVLGWQLVVKKGEYHVGDLVIYVEIDSLMPEKPVFEFLKPRSMRIRTVRLRGQISQGICFSLDLLPPDFIVEEGKDCTEVLGIVKYEPPLPACLSGLAKGKFPSFIPKTDETRVQILQNVLDKYQGERCYVTEKLDGSSATFFINNGEFGVCSRNLEYIEDDRNSFWKVAKEENIEEKLRSMNGNFALQGELIGEGIQNNKYKIKGQIVRFFNIFDIDQYEYLDYERFSDLMNTLGLQSVPVISTNYELSNSIGEIVKLATMRSNINSDIWAEGIVVRSLVEKIDAELSAEGMSNGRITFKAINPEFLLKYGE